MATAGQTSMNMPLDVCELARSWPLCTRERDAFLVTTHCQLPNGSLIKLRIRPMGRERWIVSDNGAALDEALCSGVEHPAFGLNVRRAIRSKGLNFVDGRIESPRITADMLFSASVIVANAARDVAETLLMLGDDVAEKNLDQKAREILISKFHSWVSQKPVTIEGASERPHKFANSLTLPDGRRILIDSVKHQGNSINSAVVANLDVQRLENPKLIQRVVFDPTEKWKPEEIALLEVGATPVALPNLGQAIERAVA